MLAFLYDLFFGRDSTPLVPCLYGPGIVSWTRPSKAEVNQLRRAIESHGEGGCALVMSPRDTSFLDTAPVEDDVINTVKSIPVHY